MMERGFFDAATDLIQACVEKGVKVDNGVHRSVNMIRRKLTEATGILQQAKLQSSTVVAPAFEWAQSRDQVFLGVKFAHKLDAPACIDLADERIEILSKRVSLSATCKGKHKTFHLELELLDEIDPDKSSWTLASVGRGTFSLVKAEPDVRWHRLLKSATDKPRNMHTWWQLTEKYAKELDDLDAAKTKTSKEKPKRDGKAAEDEANGDVQGTAGEGTGEKAEVDPVVAAQEAERAALQKRAKKDNKRASKEAKKATKAVDAELKEKLRALDEKHTADRKAAEDEAKKAKDVIGETKKKQLEQIQEHLAEALAKLDDGTSGASEGLLSLYEKMSDMIFGSNTPSEPKDAEAVSASESESVEKEL
ncbi:Hypothetical Protein FCC1311_001112 [Hondaea fermentalgiana]|uniref:CS domain-containing protein n=1 Tax=Hondaea fermentalgiana TaxID=2315210 RepID=A0A2R5FYR0_9STRA|nr:Hypothetical Protein FCC1311_001112 [Hondaea fermentalgiana]|eukprot:GBG23892.1 Hypothetical Protein FCC1311_001112 [Hondaea fermentalgiana]